MANLAKTTVFTSSGSQKETPLDKTTRIVRRINEDEADVRHQKTEPPPVCRRLQSKYGWSLWKKVTERTGFQLRCAPVRFG